MSLEATAGKNPINHVGKIYNVLANQTANKLGGEEVDVFVESWDLLDKLPVFYTCMVRVDRIT